MSVAKQRTAVTEPVPGTVEPDRFRDGEASAESSQRHPGDRLARWRPGLRRTPAWVVCGVVVVVVALVGVGVTQSGGNPATASTQQLVTVTRGTLSNTVSAQGTV